MKNVNINIPRSTSQGAYVRTQAAPVQNVSPRKNGRLVIQQNNFRMIRRWLDSTVAVRIISNVSGEVVSHFDPTATSDNCVSYKYVPFLYADEAWSDARSKITDAVSDLGEMYATRQQTINMVTSKVRTLTRAYSALRRRDWRGFESALGIKARRRKFNKPAEAWLEYTYGWSPLIHEVWKMIDHPFAVPSTVCHGTATHSFDDSLSKTIGRIAYVSSSTHTIRCHARVSVSVTGAWIQAASQYGLNNPALTAWDLVPYSFVVDWFIPVGEFLTQLGAFAGLSFSDASVTEVSDFSRSWMATNQIKYADPGVQFAPSRVVSERERIYEKRRQKASFNPYGFPTFGNGLNLSRFTSALALMQTAFSKDSWHK